MDPRPYSARNVQDLRRDSIVPDSVTVLDDLGPAKLRMSASRWTRDHLVAFRLLVDDETTVLKTFQEDHDNDCPICRPNGSQQIDREMVGCLLQHISRDDLLQTEARLLKKPAGALWVALAQACQSTQDVGPRQYPERIREPPARKEYVDSSAAIHGSSSPTQPSGSDYGDWSSQGLDEDRNEDRRGLPEETAVRLAMEFFRYALQLCLQQESDTLEVRPRITRMTTTTSIAGNYNVSCEDDGGIALFERRPDCWREVNPFYAKLEAKRAPQHLRIDPRTERASSITSDAVLAQCLGEAVLTWDDNQRSLSQGLVLISSFNVILRSIVLAY